MKRRSIIRKENQYLIEENWEFGRRVILKKLRSWSMQLPPDEIDSLLGLALVEAASRFNPEAGASFQTFSYYYIFGALTDLIDKSKRQQHVRENVESAIEQGAVDDIRIHIEAGPEEAYFEHEAAAVIERASKELDPLERMIIKEHFLDDKPIRKIAKDNGRCHSQISRAKTRAVKILRKAISTKVNV